PPGSTRAVRTPSASIRLASGLDLVRLLFEVGKEVPVELRQVLQDPLQDLLGLLALRLHVQRRFVEVRVAEIVARLDDLLFPLQGFDQRDEQGLLASGELDPEEVVLLLDDANLHRWLRKPGHLRALLKRGGTEGDRGSRATRRADAHITFIDSSEARPCGSLWSAAAPANTRSRSRSSAPRPRSSWRARTRTRVSNGSRKRPPGSTRRTPRRSSRSQRARASRSPSSDRKLPSERESPTRCGPRVSSPWAPAARPPRSRPRSCSVASSFSATGSRANRTSSLRPPQRRSTGPWPRSPVRSSSSRAASPPVRGSGSRGPTSPIRRRERSTRSRSSSRANGPSSKKSSRARSSARWRS